MNKQNQDKLNVINLSQYIGKVSFENKKTKYELLKLKLNSEIDFSVAPKTRELRKEDKDLDVSAKGQGLYEAILDITVTSRLKAEDRTDQNLDNEIYKLELEYIGLFKFAGEATQELTTQILLVNCMELIFPFARREIAALILASGHDVVLLDPINFKQSYSQYEQKKNKIESDKAVEIAATTTPTTLASTKEPKVKKLN